MGNNLKHTFLKHNKDNILFVHIRTNNIQLSTNIK